MKHAVTEKVIIVSYHYYWILYNMMIDKLYTLTYITQRNNSNRLHFVPGSKLKVKQNTKY